MSIDRHLGFAGIFLTFVITGVALIYPQRVIGIGLLALGAVILGLWIRTARTGPVESRRFDWLGLESKFKDVHDAAPRPTPGIPWHGGNPHPFATCDGRQWELRGENAELKKQMEVLSYDAGTQLLRSPKLKRTLDPSIRREKDPIVRWLKFLRANQEFSKTFHLTSQSGGKTRTTEVGFIEFLPNVSVRAARRCAALS